MRFNVAMLAAALVVSAPAAARKSEAPTLSPLEIQQIQTREFDADISVVYPSIITILQDAGYSINTSDRAGGIITASAASKSKITYNIFWGLGSKKRTQVATFFIEPRGARSRVRLNITNGELKRNLYGGTRGDNDVQLLDPAVYREIFDKLDQAIFVRVATDGPAPAPAAAPAVATSVAAPAVVATPSSPTPGVTAVPVSAPASDATSAPR